MSKLKDWQNNCTRTSLNHENIAMISPVVNKYHTLELEIKEKASLLLHFCEHVEPHFAKQPWQDMYWQLTGTSYGD
jgi:hypothetical protein